jgi:flagellar basal-body rod modification protein FlgD
MSTGISPLTSTSTPASQTSATALPANDPLASESTFLTLLVSQLQNQDPLDPVDSNQFVSQLTGYSQLEQLIGIHDDTTNLSQVASTAAAQTASPATAAGTANQTNSTTGAN